MTDHPAFVRYDYIAVATFDDARLGNRLRSMRVAHGKTLVVIAKAMEISESYLSKLECGERRWDDQRIDAYLTALDEPIEEY